MISTSQFRQNQFTVSDSLIEINSDKYFTHAGCGGIFIAMYKYLATDVGDWSEFFYTAFRCTKIEINTTDYKDQGLLMNV